MTGRCVIFKRISYDLYLTVDNARFMELVQKNTNFTRTGMNGLNIISNLMAQVSLHLLTFGDSG